jgi:hypothetical protein
LTKGVGLGPCPPKGDPHRYYFKLYALNVHTLGLPAGAKRAEVLEGLKGHILAEAEYMGRFQAKTAHEVAYQAEHQQRQLRLAGAKTAPGGKNATRRIKGWRLGVIVNRTRESKMEISGQGKNYIDTSRSDHGKP